MKEIRLHDSVIHVYLSQRQNVYHENFVSQCSVCVSLLLKYPGPPIFNDSEAGLVAHFDFI